MSSPVACRTPGRAAPAVALGVLGVAALGVVATVWLGLFVTPPDEFMGNLVRLLYIHPPMAWVAFLAYGVACLASLLYLWPRTRAEHFDRLAGRVGGGRRRLHRSHARHRLDLGAADLGHVVDLGPAAHDDGAAVRALPRLPRAAPGARRVRRPGPALGDRGARSPSSTCRSSTSRSSGGGACTRRPPCSTRRPTRPTCTARWPGRCCSASCRSRSSTSG